MADNVLRVPEVWLLRPYPLRFWEHAVICSATAPNSERATDGVPLNITLGGDAFVLEAPSHSITIKKIKYTVVYKIGILWLVSNYLSQIRIRIRIWNKPSI
ncbi:hypothetical protein [Desulfosporosinus lacus]|uniref:hypothetical protein n=1 Tax=Desulfosporosinus lacus TaxID=329936 RepID=UPI0011611D8C|nr:hypothetical protein [Desulfosporosinus lacus]